MGVTQAVMVNLLFFIPAAYLISLAVMNLLRQGKLSIRDWAVGLVTYLLVVTALIIAAISENQPLLSDTPEMRTAEQASAVLYLLMQAYYSGMNTLELKRIKRTLEGYYDQDKGEILNWMRNSVSLLGLSGLMAPIAIFWSGGWLLVYSLTLFITIFYCVISFYSYGVDHARQKELSDAEESAEETGLNEMSNPANIDEDERVHVEKAIERWIQQGGHLKNGVNMAQVVREIGVPRYQLTQWLRTTEWELFNPWLTHLRLEEAKKLLEVHPGWSNDTIAERCGFSSRSYFQTVFKKSTGLSPTEFSQRRP